MATYYLMHKNNRCGIIEIDDISGSVTGYKDDGNGLSPYLGNAELDSIKRWWMNRAIPANRETIHSLINRFEVASREDYLAKNLALSVTDTYWICPIDSSLTYDDINFFKLREYNEGIIPYHNSSSYDPNASLGGQMDKYWDLNGNVPVLVKESYRYFGQQSINEVFASNVYALQNNDIAFVRYDCEDTEDGGKRCRCRAFTSGDIELVSAYEITCSEKTSNNKSDYDSYIDLCVSNGIDKDLIREFMDYQTAMDFIISNTDEHLYNFGVLRDANSMKLLGPAPIFDSGNSMFYADLMKRPFTRTEMLEREVTSFYKKEEKLLKQIKNKMLVKMDLLPSPEETEDFYSKNGIPESRARIIAQNYMVKLQMFREFQQGKTISLYNEKNSTIK